MIRVFEQDGKKLLASLDVYKEAGYHYRQYSRFLNTNIHENAIKEIDYFDIIDEEQSRLIIKKNSPPYPKVYFFSFDFAITLCFRARTEKAKKLRIWLQKNK